MDIHYNTSSLKTLAYDIFQNPDNNLVILLFTSIGTLITLFFHG